MELLDKEKLLYTLPEERIALSPVTPRDISRLKIIRLPSLKTENRIFKDIYEYIYPDDVIVVNDSKVIPARIKGKRITGGNVEFLLVKNIKTGLWSALGKPASRLKEGQILKIIKKNKNTEIIIRKKLKDGNFILETPENILNFGDMPLPPYITSRRETTDKDIYDYQTIFAEKNGSVAAPTASLHFTGNLRKKFKKNGIKFAPVTLHVGPGTFRKNYEKPDVEYIEINSKTADILNSAESLCVCGTTAMRALQTVYHQNEFKAYKGMTDLFITPGFRFRKVNKFITNFHLSGTPLMLMVSAFIEQVLPGNGADVILEIYQRALKEEYRFLSYGDAMLLINERQ